MKTHKYTIYLFLIYVFHGVQQTKTKEINHQYSHGLDYSSESNNQKKNYNTTTYNLVHQLQSTSKPFLQKTSLPKPTNNENIHLSTENAQNQYVGLSLIRKENSNKLLSTNNSNKFTPSLNSNTAPEEITLLSRFNTDEQQCFKEQKIYYNGKCENLFSHDSCGVGKVLVLDIKSALLPEPKIVPKCVQNNCSGNKAFWTATKQCYSLNDTNSNKLCLSGNQFEQDYFSAHGICRCKDSPVYGEFYNGACYELFTQGPCPESHIFVEENQVANCIKNPCKNSSHILWEDGDKKCYELNSQGPCDEENKFIISSKTKKPTCIRSSTKLTIVNVPEFCDDKIPGDCQNDFKINKGSEYIKRILLQAKKKLNKTK